MKKIQVDVSCVVLASAPIVYQILADYTLHPRILPSYFTGLDILEGGIGAGTRIKVFMNFMGAKRTLEMMVTEPYPGLILAETDVHTGLVTTFTVRPLHETCCDVTIATCWEQKPGLGGWLDRWTTPPVMRHIYRNELAILADFAPKFAVTTLLSPT